MQPRQFESTLPIGEPELMRLSAFGRYLDTTASGDRWTRLSSLSAALTRDLQRFDDAAALEPLDVLAAALRHRRSVLVHLQIESRVFALTIDPTQREVHSPMTLEQLLEMRLCDLVVLRVEPAEGPMPDCLVAPLGNVAWELALRGSRGELLPEIVGPAAYRIAPGTPTAGLALKGTLAAAVARLARETANLSEIASWPGFDRERAARLLNALYLQPALIISRTHPAATQERWRAGR